MHDETYGYTYTDIYTWRRCLSLSKGRHDVWHSIKHVDVCINMTVYTVANCGGHCFQKRKPISQCHHSQRNCLSLSEGKRDTCRSLQRYVDAQSWTMHDHDLCSCISAHTPYLFRGRTHVRSHKIEGSHTPDNHDLQQQMRVYLL